MPVDVAKQSLPNNWKVSKTQDAEAQLWRAFKSGDESAYIVIYQKYFRVLYGYGSKICADPETVKDCIQDLFIDLWNRRMHLADTDSITFYLWASLKRRIVKVLAKAHHSGADDSYPLLHSSEPDAEVVLIAEEIAAEQGERIVWAMQKLSKRQREAIRLKYYQHLSNEEIARQMSIQVEAVYNLISKALSCFRKSVNRISIVLIILALYW